MSEDPKQAAIDEINALMAQWRNPRECEWILEEVRKMHKAAIAPPPPKDKKGREFFDHLRAHARDEATQAALCGHKGAEQLVSVEDLETGRQVEVPKLREPRQQEAARRESPLRAHQLAQAKPGAAYPCDLPCVRPAGKRMVHDGTATPTNSIPQPRQSMDSAADPTGPQGYRDEATAKRLLSAAGLQLRDRDRQR